MKTWALAFFSLRFDGVQEGKAVSLPCGVAGCKCAVLGWFCGWSSDRHKGAIIHWPLLNVRANIVGFFQLLFFSWAGSTVITIRTEKEMWVKALWPSILHRGMYFNTSGASKLKWLHVGCLFQWTPIKTLFLSPVLGDLLLFLKK